MDRRTKIVWLCPLDISPYLDNNNISFVNNKVPTILAPWISILIEEFSNRKEVELHIISEFSTLNKDISFNSNSIHFHILSQKMLYFKRGWPHLLKFYSNYFLLKRKVNSLIADIKPEIIHLHGTEHDLGAVFIDLQYPKLVSIQGFISSVYKQKQTNYYLRKLSIENKILKSSKNFLIRAGFMKGKVLSINKSARLFHLGYPVRFSDIIKDNKKIISDSIVFAARITKDKGIEDLYKAVSIIKNSIPQIKLKVIGPVSDDYKVFLREFATKLGINENIDFRGFLSSQKEVHNEILKSKLYILPTYHDVVPGSIAEAMYLGIPVVSYDIDGVNDFNKNELCIFLVKKGDVLQLANKIVYLLKNEKARLQYIDVARKYVIENLSKDHIVSEMIEIYDRIISLETK